MNKQVDKNEEKNPQEEKIRRKDSKMIDNVLKTLTNLDVQDKYDALIDKYKELYENHRQSQNALNSLKKKNSTLQQENEHITNENNKLNLVRNRLEKLSREFQRQNKILKEENFIKIKEEEERRRKITVEFQKALSNVTAMMAESNDQNTKLGEENKLMARRLSSIYEDFKNRQSEVDRFSKQIELERQLAETRIAKLSAEFTVEKEKVCAEKDLLLKRCEFLTTELKVSTEKSSSLEKTVGEFQKTITKSSDIFDHCKSEIANMSEYIQNQQKKLLDWQEKNEKNLATIRELTILNNQKCKLNEQITKQQAQLTKLCRRLQAERTAYINALRTNGFNPDDIVVEAPEDLEETSSNVTNTVITNVTKKNENLTGKGKKNKKNKKVDFESGNEPPDSLTLKEIQLAELKDELKRVQERVEKIQCGKIEVKIDDNGVTFEEKEKPFNQEIKENSENQEEKCEIEEKTFQIDEKESENVDAKNEIENDGGKKNESEIKIEEKVIESVPKVEESKDDEKFYEKVV
ncbi:alpha-taxilin-like [Onthophagus taurus]|uniref:alpha-taxilin-like n=1 Tax=Onthophagus taurus TaxID=166361 RepID=UPI000C20AC07|nr:alpha-taxilin-like [Onthophagus taurus]